MRLTAVSGFASIVPRVAAAARMPDFPSTNPRADGDRSSATASPIPGPPSTIKATDKPVDEPLGWAADFTNVAARLRR